MRKFLVLPAILLVSACTVGPDYAGPPAVLSAPGGTQGGFVRAGAETEASAVELADWWKVLGDPVLDELEQQALAGNPDLAAARARLDRARASLRLEKANSTPQVGAIGTAAHIRIPGLGGDEGSEGGAEESGTSTNFYNLGLSTSWEIDLFGGKRRNDEAVRAELDGADASVADARVGLTSAVAQAYLEYRDRQQRLALAQDAVLRHEALLDLQRQRFERGVSAQGEVEQAQLALEAARQQVSPLKAEADRFANAAAILVGKAPGGVDSLLAAPAAIPLPPQNIAISDPEALLRRRPDIRVAERKLAAETARIGVAEAARFPSLSFMGILGVGGTRPADLTNLDDFTAIAAPMLQWNFLDFGRGKAQVGQAEAKRDEAEAAYRGTVLGALRDVEDALVSFRATREAIASQARAEASSAKLEQLSRQRFDLGSGTKIALLQAELDHNAAQARLTRSRAQLTIDFVGLQKALGLGWSSPE